MQLYVEMIRSETQPGRWSRGECFLNGLLEPEAVRQPTIILCQEIRRISEYPSSSSHQQGHPTPWELSSWHMTAPTIIAPPKNNRSYKLLQIEKLLKQNQTQSVIKRYQFACGKVVSCFLHLAPGVLSVEKVLSSLCVAIWYWKLHFKKFSVVLPGKLLSVDVQTVWN